MASGMFDAGRQAIGRGQIAWEAGPTDIRAMLMLDTYVFNPAHAFVADLVAFELTATDYARKSTAGRAVGASAPTYFTLNDIDWLGLGGASNQTIGGLVLYLHTGSDATGQLICFADSADYLTQDQDVRAVFGSGRIFSWGG